MKETVESVAHEIFFSVCEKKPTEIDIFFLDTINFPIINYGPRMSVRIPLPRNVHGMSVYEGIVFSNYDSGKETIWNLFFASVCHAAAHAQITGIEKYLDWIKGKNLIRAYSVMEAIEDIRINNFLKQSFPEYYQSISIIDEKFKTLHQINEINNKKENIKQQFSEKYARVLTTIDVLEEKIATAHSSDLLEYAGLLYNAGIRTKFKIPYRNYYPVMEKVINWKRNLVILPQGLVLKNANNFADLWFEQIKRKEKVWRRYRKITSNLNFDVIEFTPENIGEYLRLRNATHLFLKKISSQLKMVPNVMDENIPEDMGLLQMQAAIQAVASQNANIQIFEQDDYRRIEEEWTIILDTSSSMRLKFDEIKKFAICLGEAANELNSKNGRWGFFTFNNNFRIVKDHNEKYDYTARSRIGGIEISGLSFIGDAVKLCSRMLEKDNVERKYIFIITDGQQVGTLGGNKEMEDAVVEARNKGISVVAIGIPQGTSKIFSLSMPYENLRKTVARFINSYTALASANI
jgi:hypothetical protein